jgi:hypothetical protein
MHFAKIFGILSVFVLFFSACSEEKSSLSEPVNAESVSKAKPSSSDAAFIQEFWDIISLSQPEKMNAWLKQAHALGKREGWKNHEKVLLLIPGGCLSTFTAGEYWKIFSCFDETELASRLNPDSVNAKVFHLSGVAFKKLILGTEEEALKALAQSETHGTVLTIS